MLPERKTARLRQRTRELRRSFDRTFHAAHRKSPRLGAKSATYSTCLITSQLRPGIHQSPTLPLNDNITGCRKTHCNRNERLTELEGGARNEARQLPLPPKHIPGTSHDSRRRPHRRRRTHRLGLLCRISRTGTNACRPSPLRAFVHRPQ